MLCALVTLNTILQSVGDINSHIEQNIKKKNSANLLQPNV